MNIVPLARLVVVVAAFALPLQAAPCKLKKPLKVQVKKDGASSWVTLPGGTTLDVTARDPQWSQVTSPQASGRTSTSLLESSCEQRLPDLEPIVEDEPEP